MKKHVLSLILIAASFAAQAQTAECSAFADKIKSGSDVSVQSGTRFCWNSSEYPRFFTGDEGAVKFSEAFGLAGAELSGKDSQALLTLTKQSGETLWVLLKAN